MGPKGKKGGPKKPVSKVKRANQKMNKLVKAGKAKPKSKPRYVPNQKKSSQGEKETWLTPELRKKWQESQEEDREAALDQLAETISGQEAAYLTNLHGSVKRKHDSDEEQSEDDDNEEELGEMEREAMKRIEFEKNNEKQVRGLLPIKTRDGVKQRIEEKDESDGEESGEEEDEEMEEEGEGEDGDNIGDDNLGHEVSSGQQYSVVELYAKRKEIIAEKKVTIGSLASNFLEAPEERIINLEKLVKMFSSDNLPKTVDLTVERLVAASILELLKHVTPGYKINPQDLNDGVKLKKETLKLVKYETALLKCYKNYLIRLEKLVNLIKGKQSLDKATSSQAIFFLSCMCQLLVQHPHFNFSKNILHALIPILSNSNDEARNLVKNALEEVFKNDMRGEISLEATRLINHLVKSRKHNVRTEVVSVLLCLRIKNVDLDREKKEEIERKKMEARKKKLLEKSKISKQEKKRRKKLESLEKELLEARGEEGKKVKEKYFTETTQLVFTIYFRILKSYPKSKLMGVVLEGLSKFAHIINIEFFSDLLSVFQDLLEGGTLSYRDTLLATGTVFKILSGQGESLNIDPTNFYSHLYSSIMSLSLTSSTTSTPLALSSLQDMLIGRRKKVSKARVLGFTKRMCTVSLQQDHAGCVGVLALIRQLLTTHPVTSHLLDSEHEVGNGIFDPSLGDPEHCNAGNTTAWELSMMQDHYHPTSVRLARHLLSGCPSQGEASLPHQLKVAPDQLYHQFSPDTMTFNPPVQPPKQMSSRSLRKLQEKKDDIQDDPEESGEDVGARGKSSFNAFLLLNESCSESEEVKEDDDLESAKSPAPVVNTEKKKKRRKKKSGKKMPMASSEDNIDNKDDIEETVKWVEENIGQPGNRRHERTEEKAHNPLKKILSIENKNLNPENEMKRIFGSRVVSTEAVRHKKGRGGRTAYQRSALLVTPRPAWPAGARSGLSMRPVESEEAGSWFTFDHSPTYQQVQMRFLSAVESLNPDLIVAILNTAPSHIDSLLQLSDICKMGDDSAMAAELVERAIYALESGFHPCFNLAAGNCHLDYKRQENRAIFIALFRHLHYVGSRACYRTALEICKVLLNLDPSVDPLAIVLLVDFYAIRSRSYQWLIDFFRAANPTRNLSQLPNFAFSVALATFHRYLETKTDQLSEEADSFLQEALLSFPSVLLPLLDKCSIEPDPSVQGCSFFLDCRSDPPALSALTTLYVTRNFHCWKEPELLPWLERNVRLVVARVSAGDPRVSQSRTERSSRYQGLPKNIHRHIVISENNKEALAHLPADLKQAVVLAWDPLPPLNSINTYVAPERQPTAIDDPSALRMFFRSLMPNFNPAEPALAAVEGAGAGPGEGGGADLRHSVHNLLDAMRDLLGNLQLPEVEAGDEASDEERDAREWD